jgi:hypothetical protein
VRLSDASLSSGTHSPSISRGESELRLSFRSLTMDADLTPEQTAAFNQFRALMDGADGEVVLGVLQSVDWDVQVFVRSIPWRTRRSRLC